MIDKAIRKTTGMKAPTVDELTVNYEMFGVVIRRELHKEVLFNLAGHVKIAFFYEELSKNGPSKFKVMVASFRCERGVYCRRSYFIFSLKEYNTFCSYKGLDLWKNIASVV